MKKLSKRKKIIASAVLLILVLLVIGYSIFGEPFFVARIRCGGDPIYHSTGFKEGQEYVTPNNPSYRFYADGPFKKYFCTEEQAQAAGYYKDLNAEELAIAEQQDAESKLLKNSPVDFTVYEPSILPDGVTKDQLQAESKNEVRQVLYKSGGRYGIIYQSKAGSGPNTYGQCNGCQLVARTSDDISIGTVYVPGGNITKWVITKVDTEIAVVIYGQQKMDGVTDKNITGLFNSLERAN